MNQPVFWGHHAILHLTQLLTNPTETGNPTLLFLQGSVCKATQDRCKCLEKKAHQ